MAYKELKSICKFFDTPSIKKWIKLPLNVDQIHD